MIKKNTETAKLLLLSLGTLAALFAIVGAIGFISSLGNLSGLSSNLSKLASAASSVIAVFVFHDFARFGALGVFAMAAACLIVDYTSETGVKRSSIVAGAASVFGFIGVIMISLTSLMNSLLSVSAKVFSSSSAASSAAAGILALVIVGEIFIFLSALPTIVVFIIALVKRARPYGYQNSYNYGYPQYPQQGVPVQTVQPMAQPVQTVQPVAQPVQQPVYTAPVPEVQGSWNCSCGTVNSADSKFCFACGKPRQ